MESKEIEEGIARAEAEERKENFATALSILTDLIKKYPKRYEPFEARSAVSRRSGDFAAAFTDLEAIIELVPNEPAPFFRRGRWKIETKDYQGAINDLSEVIRMGGEYFLEAAYHIRSEAFLRLGKYDEALHDCGRVSDGYYIGPKHPSKEDIIREAMRDKGKQRVVK